MKVTTWTLDEVALYSSYDQTRDVFQPLNSSALLKDGHDYGVEITSV